MLQHKVEAIGKELDEPNRQSSEGAGLVFDEMLYLFAGAPHRLIRSALATFHPSSHFRSICWLDSDLFVAHGWHAFTSGRISHIIQFYVGDQWSGSTRQQLAWWCKCNRLAWLWAISSHKKKGQKKSTSLLISLMPDANQGRAGVCGVKAMGSGRGHAWGVKGVASSGAPMASCFSAGNAFAIPSSSMGRSSVSASAAPANRPVILSCERRDFYGPLVRELHSPLCSCWVKIDGLVRF